MATGSAPTAVSVSFVDDEACGLGFVAEVAEVVEVGEAVDVGEDRSADDVAVKPASVLAVRCRRSNSACSSGGRRGGAGPDGKLDVDERRRARLRLMLLLVLVVVVGVGLGEQMKTGRMKRVSRVAIVEALGREKRRSGAGCDRSLIGV